MMRPARPGHCESQKSSLRRLMMEWFNILIARLRALFQRESVLQDIEEELRVHVEMETETNIERGMAPDEARAAALKSFGALGRNIERGYDIRGGGWLETFWQDLRYGARGLTKSPGFTAIAALTLALGIGANTALFSLVDAVLLKKLPVRNPEELALFRWAQKGTVSLGIGGGPITRTPATGLSVGATFSVPAFEQLRSNTRALSDLFAFASRGELNVGVGGQAEIASGQLVSGNFHTALGVRSALGRMITDDDDRASANPVTVISHRYWRSRFGLDPAIVGKTISVNGAPFTIIGVTPPQFYAGMEFGDSPDLTLPTAFVPLLDHRGQSQSAMTQAWFWWVNMMGRRKPGVSLEQVRAELEGVFQQSALAGWESMPNRPANAGSGGLPQLRVLPGGQGEGYLRESYAQPLRVMLY